MTVRIPCDSDTNDGGINSGFFVHSPLHREPWSNFGVILGRVIV